MLKQVAALVLQVERLHISTGKEIGACIKQVVSDTATRQMLEILFCPKAVSWAKTVSPYEIFMGYALYNEVEQTWLTWRLNHQAVIGTSNKVGTLFSSPEALPPIIKSVVDLDRWRALPIWEEGGISEFVVFRHKRTGKYISWEKLHREIQPVFVEDSHDVIEVVKYWSSLPEEVRSHCEQRDYIVEPKMRLK